MFEVDDRFSACPEALSKIKLLISLFAPLDLQRVLVEFYDSLVFDIIKNIKIIFTIACYVASKYKKNKIT